MKKALLAAIVAASLGAAALPAYAGTLEWKDAEGDATGIGVVTSTPLPSDAQFDITKVKMATGGGNLVWTTSLKKAAAGVPTLSSGYYFRFAFTYAGATYWFIVGDDATGAENFSLAATATGSTALPCPKCTGKINRKENAVTVTAPIASFAAAMKAASKDAPPVGPGAKLEALYVIAQRRAVAATLTADEARAPEGAAFTF